MYIIDFEYDGEMLSDHGAIMGGLNLSNDENTPLGMTLTTNTVKNLDINYIASSQYDEVLTKNFQIIKNPCYTDGSQNNMYFTDEEIYEITTWLVKKQYKKFKPVYNDNSFSDVVFYGIFSVEAVRMNGNVIGFNLVLTTNAPYAFGDEVEYNVNLDENNASFKIYNSSQEFGYLYPNKVMVVCGEAGIFSLYNETDESEPNRRTIVKNCSVGEILTFDCKNKIITSNQSHLGLYNDFNYNFPRFVSEYNKPENCFKIDVSEESIHSMMIHIQFSPIRKIGVI